MYIWIHTHTYMCVYIHTHIKFSPSKRAQFLWIVGHCHNSAIWTPLDLGQSVHFLLPLVIVPRDFCLTVIDVTVRAKHTREVRYMRWVSSQTSKLVRFQSGIPLSIGFLKFLNHDKVHIFYLSAKFSSGLQPGASVRFSRKCICLLGKDLALYIKDIIIFSWKSFTNLEMFPTISSLKSWVKPWKPWDWL